MAIGKQLGVAPEELEDLRQAAELHDMGKVAIPDAILDKPGPLDDAEWDFMRRHTIVGERILQAAPALERVARIVLVCDAFQAMTADGSYRRAMSRELAIEELERCAGAQFDPRVVAAFRELTGGRAKPTVTRSSPS